ARQSELRGLEGKELEAALSEIRTILLDSLIANELMEQAMDRADLTVADRDLEAAIADVAKQNGITVERLFLEIAKQGMDEESYRAEMRKQLRQYQFMNLEIRSRVEVSEEEIRSAWLQANSGREPETALRLQRILLSFSPGKEEALRKEAVLLLEELRAGKDFATVAQARSDDASTAEKGGAAGLVKPDELSGAFAEALAGAKEGDIVSVEVPSGIFLLRVAELVDTSVQAFEAVRDELARSLYDQAMDRELELWTQEERRRSHIEVFL
ncbi:MAG: peptidylprolyl isomerase, partial [Myxococcota bacterium]|nr:peptidylprolyl isomerase [Myxococcota bacterium]